MSEKRRATLTLDDGTPFGGFLFGAPLRAEGTVVFNTAMAGYPELLSDPALSGCIAVLTYPSVGNCGVNKEWLESAGAQVQAIVVTDYSPEPSHWNTERDFESWLVAEGVTGMTGVDTRALAKHLREHGAQNGRIEAEGLGQARAKTYTPIEGTTGSGSKKITLVDCGVTNSLVKMLGEKATVKRVKPDHDFTQDGADMIVVAGGAGDPHEYRQTIETLRKALQNKTPIHGFEHGHLLMALAAGANLQRLVYGHHGHNQPVIAGNKVEITHQNHLWAVDAQSLPTGWEATMSNLNDKTNEGMRHTTLPFSSTQFTPANIDAIWKK